MTDNEIIKALECCEKFGGYHCDNVCPLFYNGATIKSDCRLILHKAALDLINRQKAEIVRLYNILLSFTDEVHTWSNKKGYDTTELSLIPILNKAESVREAIKSEAVKEFAERFENEFDKIEEFYFEEEHENFVSANKVLAFLDNLVKEMVGEG